MRIGFATSGLWRLRTEIEQLTGATARRLWPLALGVDAIAGWGHKPTADRARRLARLRGLPYLAFEDGLLRSVQPGDGEPPLSLVLDRSGIYYDARQPSDLEDLVRDRLARPETWSQARNVISRLRETRLSKYNDHPAGDLPDGQARNPSDLPRVLVIDQTAGDASITGALATQESFTRMFRAAVHENPDAEILLRIHPEAITGRKKGHFDQQFLSDFASLDQDVARALETGRVKLDAAPRNPWSLLERCNKVYCVSSQLGFEAIMAQREVHSFGVSFYSGYGLTVDRTEGASALVAKRRQPVPLEALVAALYFDYCHYFGRSPLRPITVFEAIDWLERKVAETR
ncbi:hypothetical protein [Roseibium aestuarii]|uniref:Capsular polysaccharide export protein n=1 Tax=Roseibium aestuarii TaxID=2600299 RepID=A0ABW4K2S2_9HYPH|nr:hypothetical protein [Roseibium aestuarii]